MISAAVLAVALGAPASSNFDAFTSALKSAEGLQATLKSQEVSRGVATYNIALAKPNKARIETPTRLAIADGETVTIFMKTKNKFFTKEQSPEVLGSLFDNMALSTFVGFFDETAYNGVASATNGKDRKLGGQMYDTANVTADRAGETTMTFFFDQRDHLPRRVLYTTKTLIKRQSSVLSVDPLILGAPSDDEFIFHAPEDAEEVSEESMAAGVWHYDWDEAIGLADAGDKLMMVDFFTTWCGPCKMMDEEAFQSDEFKKVSGDFVLVKIDCEKGDGIGLAKQYKVNAYPTVKFINSDGEIVHEFVGYGGKQMVLDEMKKAQAKFKG
jgi:thiol-disulfide isomerase/thioredoxin